MASIVMGASASGMAGLPLTKVSDSIVDTNALLFNNTGTWGRAINGEAFQGAALVSHEGYQYTAWYRNDANRSVMIARRAISGTTAGAWDVVNTPFRLQNTTNDVHNTISIGLAKSDGTLHLSWDHHVNSLNYARSAAGVATSNPGAWGAGMFTKSTSGNLGSVSVGAVTYPYFLGAPSGDLTFMYRSGSSGDGEYKISNYSGAAGTWSTPGLFIGKTGTYVEGSYSSTSRNGYPNGLDYGPDGKLHTIWVWREDGGGSNHDINYASSSDSGITWRNNAGTQVANTAAGDSLTLSDPGLIVRNLDLKQSLYNTQGQTVDRKGGVHALMWHRRQNDPAYAWQSGDPNWDPKDSAYHHYYRDPATGNWAERMLPTQIVVDGVARPLPIGRRGQILTDAAENAYAIYTTRIDAGSNSAYASGNLVIAGASAASGYSDWTVLHIEDVGFNGEPLVDKERLLRDGVISVFLQEDSASTSQVGTKLHVLEFAVPEPTGAFAAGLVGTVLLGRRHR